MTTTSQCLSVINHEDIHNTHADLSALSDLAVKLLGELAEHPIGLPPAEAFSPASLGKAYLRSMGIEPILKRQPDFPTEYLGFAQTAFFGGRTSVNIRKVVCPVVYTGYHPVSKNADTRGKPSGKQTLGLLRRRHVRVGQIHNIGRESNNLEEVESGQVHSPQTVYTEYPNCGSSTRACP